MLNGCCVGFCVRYSQLMRPEVASTNNRYLSKEATPWSMNGTMYPLHSSKRPDQAVKFMRFSELTGAELEHVSASLDPSNGNLFPSVALSWSNTDGQSVVCLPFDGVVLGRVYPTG